MIRRLRCPVKDGGSQKGIAESGKGNAEKGESEKRKDFTFTFSLSPFSFHLFPFTSLCAGRVIRQCRRCRDIFQRHVIDAVAREALGSVQRAPVLLVIERPLRLAAEQQQCKGTAEGQSE